MFQSIARIWGHRRKYDKAYEAGYEAGYAIGQGEASQKIEKLKTAVKDVCDWYFGRNNEVRNLKSELQKVDAALYCLELSGILPEMTTSALNCINASAAKCFPIEQCDNKYTWAIHVARVVLRKDKAFNYSPSEQLTAYDLLAELHTIIQKLSVTCPA